MILLDINTHDYENDVRVMTLAFFPGQKIVISKETDVDFAVKVKVYDTRVIVDVLSNKQYHLEDMAAAAEKKTVRNLLKRMLYRIYSEITGKELPWGTLTGIRPTKIPYGLMEQGIEEQEIRDILSKEYLMNETKTNLSIEVAENERKLIAKENFDDTYSLYIGIPFCPTTCLYCSFTSYPIGLWKDKVDDYLDALTKELVFLGDYLKDKKALSVYIGGGTPTTLLPYQIERLVKCIRSNFDLSEIKEFTLEAGRPDSIDRDKLMAIISNGIDRISINPQTMNQRTLDIIGRKHSTSQIIETFHLARECGFKNINMDLIIGLPGENADDVAHTLEEIRKLNPDSLTVHSLAIKRAAALNIFKEKYADMDIVNTDEIINYTYNFAKSCNLYPYYLYRQKNMAGNFENVGYAKKGCEGIYNILIMEELHSIYAAGANSQSKIVYRNPAKVDRIENVKDVAEYIRRIDEMIDRKRNYFNGK